ncbi:MAG: hypothetical protein GY855_11595 [candidate division Zixibacteria bacterium]|nr:hypothetical protein [candidate division Zixibacteria bacterium]
MKIKKFTASSVSEALKKVKKEMGKDAVIIKTRQFAGAFSNSSGREIEVTAAVEQLGTVATNIKKPGSEQPTVRNLENAPNLGTNKKEFESVNELFNVNFDRLSSEQYIQLIPAEVKELYKNISKFNIDPAIVDELARATMSGNLTNSTEVSISNRWAEYIAAHCEEPESIDSLLTRQPVTISGASGSGRSTLISKLAYRCTNQNIGRPTIISVDGYNISGQYQLERISKLLNIDFLCISKISEIEKLIKIFDAGNPMLFDLPALDTTDEDDKEIITGISRLPVARVLLLNADYHYDVNEHTFEQSLVFNPTHIAASHVNETGLPGSILKPMYKTGLIPLVSAKGRKITDNIDILEPVSICRALFGKITAEDTDE